LAPSLNAAGVRSGGGVCINCQHNTTGNVTRPAGREAKAEAEAGKSKTEDEAETQSFLEAEAII